MQARLSTTDWRTLPDQTSKFPAKQIRMQRIKSNRSCFEPVPATTGEISINPLTLLYRHVLRLYFNNDRRRIFVKEDFNSRCPLGDPINIKIFQTNIYSCYGRGSR